MKITLSKRIGRLAFLLPCALALSTTVHAETNKLVIESGDSAQSRQHAAMEKEQWNDTRRVYQDLSLDAVSDPSAGSARSARQRRNLHR